MLARDVWMEVENGSRSFNDGGIVHKKTITQNSKFKNLHDYLWLREETVENIIVSLQYHFNSRYVRISLFFQDL